MPASAGNPASAGSMNQLIVARTLLYVTQPGEPAWPGAPAPAGGDRPGPGVQLTVTLVNELLGDRRLLPFLGDDDPRRDVSEDAEEAEIETAAKISRTTVTSRPVYSARPEHTPAIMRPSRVRTSRLLLPLPMLISAIMPDFWRAWRPQRAGRGGRARAPRHTLAASRPEGATPMPRSTSPAGTDLLRIDDQLTEDERLVRDTARAFAGDRVLPHVADWFEAGTLPREIAPEIGKLGLLGMHLTGYGCAGMGAVSYGVACREMEAADSGLRSLVSVQGSLCMFPIWKYGSEEQKQEWLPRMAAGEAIGCFGLTEPDHGSDPASMDTKAVRDGSDWLLSGTKMWITNGGIADVAVVWAVRRRASAGSWCRAPRGVLHPEHPQEAVAARVGHLGAAPRPGPAARGRDAARRQRAEGPAVLPVRGPLRHRVGGHRGGPRLPGVGRGVLADPGAVRPPIGGFQLTQAKLAWMLADLARAQLLALHLGRLKEAGEITPEQISLGKMANVRTAIDIARQARTVLGANGITLEYPVIRHANNLESVLTYEGTEEIHTLALGQAITGLSAYR